MNDLTGGPRAASRPFNNTRLGSDSLFNANDLSYVIVVSYFQSSLMVFTSLAVLRKLALENKTARVPSATAMAPVYS